MKLLFSYVYLYTVSQCKIFLIVGYDLKFSKCYIYDACVKFAFFKKETN